MYIPKKIRPSVPAPPGFCPCGAPGVISPWEADLLLCREHAVAWLGSAEKEEAIFAIDGDEQCNMPPAGDEALRRAIDHFADRIRPKPPGLCKRFLMWLNDFIERRM
jgi:hypothetical protein